jgi:amino acid adenylation domain-containing protein/thioester reductase-like protein
MVESGDERLARLTPAKRALYEQLLLQKRAVARAEADHPLSRAQQRYWFLERLEPGNPAHHIGGATRLDGPLDARALEAVLSELSQRHEILRTRFRLRDGEPRQHVVPYEPLRLATIDLSTLPAEERRAERARRIETLTQTAFDLEREPPWRCVLLRAAAAEHELLCCFHHIAADGVSLGIVWRELVERYSAKLERRAPRLETLPWQVRDHARRQNEDLANGRFDAAVEYWKGALAGLPELALPVDRARSRDWKARTRPALLELPEPIVQRARKLAEAHGATLHMLLLAAFGAWLARWCGQSEVAIGVPVAGRTRSELRALVGFFVNSVVVRIDTGSVRSFSALLQQVRRTSLAALEHSDLPFEHLVEALAPQRHLDRNPLFQAMFNLIDFVELRAVAQQVVFDAVPLQSGTQLDVALDAWLREGRLRLELETDPGLFDASTGPRAVAQYARFLEAVLDAPEASLADVDPTDPTERTRIRSEWGIRAAMADSALDPLAAFLAQARRAPEAVALRSGAVCLDYRASSERIDRLAAALAARGVAAADVVVVALPRCFDRALLPFALWQLGAVYAPFDLSWPELRRRRILARLDARCVIDADELEHLLSAGAERVAVRATPSSDPERPAALYFTSGSTGEPKGVLLPRRAYANHAAWVRAAFGITPADRVLHWTSPGFDAALWETLPALTAGACVELAPLDAERDPRVLAEVVAAAEVTLVQLIPALLAEWLAACDPERLRRLRHVISGGEALPGALARRFRERFEHASARPELWNLYGPTEACIDATAWRVRRDDEARATVPLGEPIAGARIRVVDAAGRELGIGQPGELWIGGPGLALSYWRDPSADEQCFVHDAGDPQLRWYRSGDRARWLADGRLEYNGRDDDQLKLRGQRIEAGEIEAALTGHPEVERAVVGLRGAPGAERLVAWFEARSSGALEPEALRDWLRQRLPEAWIPSRYERIERWPLNANGKLERAALRESDHASTFHGASTRAPLGEVETLIAQQFARVLEREHVAPEADFFALGGHSLLAARAVALLENVLGRSIPLRELFAFPSARALARRLAQVGSAALSASDSARIEPIRPRVEHGTLHASPGEERLWLLHSLEPASTAYHMAGAAIVRGRFDDGAFTTALRELVESHEALRTCYPAERGRLAPRLVSSAGPSCEVHAARALGDALAWARTRLNRPFDLATEAPLRIGYARCDSGEHVIGFVLHHIAGDGVSLHLIQDELATRYALARFGKSADQTRVAAAPPIALQPSDRALWLRAYESSERGRADLDAWRAELAGAPTVLELPTDRPRRQGRERPAGRFEFHWPLEVARAVDAVAARLGATPNMLLCAAWAIVLGRWSGARDVLIGGASAGRQRPELERLVAFCVSLLPLRIRFSDDTTFTEVVARTRAVVLDALSREEVSFERIVDALGVTRDPTRPPLVQAAFAWHAEPVASLVFDGTPAEIVEFEPTQAKLELSLEVERRADGLRCRIEWDAGLWDASSIRTLAEACSELVRGALANPSTACAALPLLSAAASAAEHAASLGPLDPARAPRTFLRQWLEHARTRPEAEALVDGATRLSHGALDALSERLAWALRARGIGPERTVGLLLARSWRSATALVSVWRAGGVALPIDVEQPPARSAWMLQDAGAALVLIDDDAVDLEGVACPVLRWSALIREGAQATAFTSAREPDFGIDPATEPARTAYVIYTSGSTGLPKGVEVEHAALATHLDWMQREFGMQSGERALHRLAPVFDAALIETACVFACGGTCIVVPRIDAADPRALAALVEHEQATLIVTLPAFFEQMLGAQDVLPRLRSLKHWICGGEALPLRAARAWRAAATRAGLSAVLWNLYGPTEATVHCIAQRVDALPEAADGSTDDAGPSVPIGRPITNTQAWVLDDGGAVLPRGWLGELWLAGPNLARGYRGRIDATARAFVWRGATRCYRSGDCVRRLPDGALVFVGRRDGQIKLRGRRIELGEIEAALAAHADVREAACLYVAAPEPHLEAHVLHAPDAALTPSALRRWLAERLPPTLLPQRLALHARFPRLSSGKVDRVSLARHEWPLEPATGEAPVGPLEALIAGVFGQLLERADVRRDDSYFALGGSSLSAVEVIGRLCEASGRELALRALFEDSTPRALAARIEREARGVVSATARRPDMEACAALAPTWRPAAGKPLRGREVRHVLVTGATGFLGAFVLAELARTTAARLHCLVRAADPAAGLQRLRAALDSYARPDRPLASPELLERVCIVPGDLSAPQLGLSAPTREQLARDVDLVLHIGARVHFVAGYAELEAENVASTRALLELAARGRAKSFHFVSTLGIVAAHGIRPEESVNELDPLSRFRELDDGYEQTKWVCERLLQQAAERGLEVGIYRPGRVGAHSASGACNRSDAASAFLRGCAKLGLLPELRGALDLTPVDYVAGAIAALALRREPSACAETWHLLNPRSTPLALAGEAFRELAREMRVVSIPDWRAALRVQARADPHHPLRPLLPLFLENRPSAAAADSLLPDLALPVIDSTRTQAALRELGITCPTIDAAWMRRWARWAVDGPG